ncbi:hypothetical protein AURDEDRAFT_30349, partial [Auricularia subglabra TFB-10046 SS5]
VVAAAERAPTNRPLHIVSKCKQVIQMLTTRLQHHERRGWLDVPLDADALRAAVAALRSRAAETTFTFVDKKRQPEWADIKDAIKMAEVAAELGPPTYMHLEEYAPFDAPGMSILGIKQRDAYRAIQQSTAHSAPPRKSTRLGVARAKAAVFLISDWEPTARQIWSSLRNPALTRNTRNFLWKAIHGAHKVGSYFSKMPPPWKDHAMCPTCRCVEDMDHIVIACPDGHGKRLWRMAQVFLSHKRVATQISIGLVMGCAAVRLPGLGSGRNKTSERAFTIVVSETAFLIWKLRCEKRIEHADDPEWRITQNEAEARWVSAIESRLRQDQVLTDKGAFGKKALPKWLVESTW